MILLDTDHLSILRGDLNDRRARLVARLESASDEDIGTTIITVEEQFRGWLAAIAKERQARRQVLPYDELARLIDFFSDYYIIRFSPPAVELFESFGRIRISTANRRDFEKVPGLRFENWLD